MYISVIYLFGGSRSWRLHYLSGVMDDYVGVDVGTLGTYTYMYVHSRTKILFLTRER